MAASEILEKFDHKCSIEELFPKISQNSQSYHVDLI